MATSQTRRNLSLAHARRTAKRVADSAPMRCIARAGFLARGALYIVIGWIALLIAFGKTRQPADRTGALHALGGNPFGEVALWLLVVGFFGMLLQRVGEAWFGAPGADGGKIRIRLAALARAVIYGFLGWGVLEYALGVGSPRPSDQQSVDLTATLMRHPGGKALIVVIGLAFACGGIYLAVHAWRKGFLGKLRLDDMGARVRPIVVWLGRVGGVARGIVFITVGVFLVVAALHSQPRQAKGLDSSLRVLAAAPLGQWLLVLVAIGLIMFGAFSCCEARWRKVV